MDPVSDWQVAGPHTMGLQGGYQTSKWHLEFVLTLRSSIATELISKHMQDIEEVYLWLDAICIFVYTPFGLGGFAGGDVIRSCV